MHNAAWSAVTVTERVVFPGTFQRATIKHVLMKCHHCDPKASSRILLIPGNECSIMSRLAPRAPKVLENHSLSSLELLCFYLHGAKEEQASSYTPLPTTLLLPDFISQGLGKGSRLRDKNTFCSLPLGQSNGKGYNFSLLPARVLEKFS